MAMSPERLAELRDLKVDSTSADAPYNPDVWTLDKAREELVAEVDRLRAELAEYRQGNTALQVVNMRLADEVAALRPGREGGETPC